MKGLSSLLLISLAVCGIAQLEPSTKRELMGARSLALSPDGSKLAFVWRGDIWVAPSAGGRAEPVTNSVEMDDTPIWSPDGTYIAFRSNRTGNNDIFVVPAEGGDTKRLTWFSGGEIPNDWSPDGKSLLMAAQYDEDTENLYTLDVKSTAIRRVMQDFQGLDWPTYSPDGKKIAYTRIGFAWSRPRYEGSGAAQLWTLDPATGQRTQIRNNGFQHQWPNWSGDGNSIYCVTVTEKTPSTTSLNKSIGKNVDNVNRTPNVYRVGLNGSATRVTNFIGGSGPRFLTVAGGKVAFEREGRVFVNDQPISLTAVVDDKTFNEQRLVIEDGAQEVALSPKGDQFAFMVRGELWTVPVKQGKGPNAKDATQLTDYPGLDEQPIYSPDGKSLFFVSDREGGRRIYKLNLETKAVSPFAKADFDHENLAFSPDKKHLWYWRAGLGGGLFRQSVDGGDPERILDKSWNTTYAISPDGKYLAYTKELAGSGFNPWENQNNLYVREIATAKEENVTKLSAQHRHPAWSADGRYLYFYSDRAGEGIYVLPLSAEDARPTEMEPKYEKPKETPKLEFDFLDADRRIRLVSPGTAFGLQFDATNGNLLFNRNGDIWQMNYSAEETRPITSGAGIGGFEFSGDGNSLYFLRAGMPSILNLRAPQNPISTVGFRADWTRDVRREREAAFMQFWQMYNRNFYDGNFHGRDWLETRGRYLTLLDSVGHRNEMATVLNMMVGELEGSHTEAGAGPGNPSSETTAHLGFTIDTTYQGPGLRIASVPFRTPGSYAKTRLSAGEYVMTVNGQDVRADQNLFKLLNGQVGREVTLTVSKEPTKAGARTVKYRALGGGEWGGIAYRNRIENRRAMVDKLSNGTVGYLHIAGMGGGNMQAFMREAWQYIQGKKAVIIDVRENGGGNIADALLDIIERKPQARYLPRDGQELTGPGSVWNMPTVVMHAESSFSNAEMFPSMMKSRGLATLVGKPTPGYVIYTYGGRLVDGTSIRLPSTGVYRLDGTPMENQGQKPDVDVDWTPAQYFAGEDPQLERAVQILMRGK